MEKKVMDFDEIFDNLLRWVGELEDWNVGWDEDLEKEIKDLFYIIDGLENKLDDLIMDLVNRRKVR